MMNPLNEGPSEGPNNEEILESLRQHLPAEVYQGILDELDSSDSTYFQLVLSGSVGELIEALYESGDPDGYDHAFQILIDVGIFEPDE